MMWPLALIVTKPLTSAPFLALTLGGVTAPSFNCAVPTLFLATAYAPPQSAANSATIATIMAGDGLLRRIFLISPSPQSLGPDHAARAATNLRVSGGWAEALEAAGLRG